MEEVKDFSDKLNTGPLWQRLGRSLLVVAITAVLWMLTAVLSGLFPTNVNPAVTLSYLVTAFLVSQLNDLNKNRQFKLLVLAAMLSWVTNFIQGTLLLLLLVPLLKKLKLV